MRYAAYLLIAISFGSSLCAMENGIYLTPFLADRSIPQPTTPPSKKLKKLELEEGLAVPIGPILTGPLLTPAANTIPQGHYNVEAYIFVTTFTGNYNSKGRLQKISPRPQTINLIVFTQIGLNSFMDFEFAPQFLFNSVEDVDSWRFGDFFLSLDLQLIRERDDKGVPALKFFIEQFLPTGTYHHLREENLGTDIGGRGTFATTFGFVASYLWRFKAPHFLAARGSISYQVATNVNVHGVNAFGGDPTTVGRVFPGDFFQIVTGFEYTLTRCWALALDLQLNVLLRTKFCGTTKVPVGRDNTSIQFSMAPALEYNYSPHVGLIGGVWFTAAGKNAPSFVSGVFAINIYI